MADERNAEQIEADEQLQAALEKASRAYGHIEDGWAIGDYVICMEYTGFSDETVGRERYAYILPHDFLPTHRLIGLLRYTEHLVLKGDAHE